MNGSLRVMGTPLAFRPLPARAMIAEKPVWLAVGLPPGGLNGLRHNELPLLTGSGLRGADGPCLLALQDEADARSLVEDADASGIGASAVRSTEGEAHRTAGLMGMPLLLAREVRGGVVTGWADALEPFSQGHPPS